MKRDTITVDDFYANPDEVVEYAKTLEYLSPYRQPGWQSSRYRALKDCPFRSSEKIVRTLENLVGEEIDLRTWRGELPLGEDGYPARDITADEHRTTWWNCLFHVKYRQSNEFPDSVHNHASNDIWNSVGRDGWVGIIYLNRDAHLRYGLQTCRNVDPSRNEDRRTSASNWQIVDSFANVFNRLILHRGHLPHSGSNGWGDSPENGRLFQTFFFRTNQVSSFEALKLERGGNLV